MKWLRCSAVSAVQYCHCVVHCVANEPSRSFTTTTAFSLLKASTSASKSRGRSIGPSLWALWQLRGPSYPALVRCAVTPVSGGWHHYARLVAGGGYTANIILITRVASEGTLGTLHWPECARNEEYCRLQCIHYTVVLTLARRSHNCGYTTPTPPTPSWSQQLRSWVCQLL